MNKLDHCAKAPEKMIFEVKQAIAERGVHGDVSVVHVFVFLFRKERSTLQVWVDDVAERGSKIMSTICPSINQTFKQLYFYST
jgi:hypothetical protein